MLYSSICSAGEKEVNSATNGTIKETDVEIIRLDCVSDEKNFAKIRPYLCSNPICGNKTDLRVAPKFVCAYYGLTEEKSHMRKVCLHCFKDAENHQDVLVELLREKRSIILGPKKPKNYLVTIDDEEIKNESPEPSEEVEIEEDLEAFVQATMDKYRFEQQTNDTVNYLEQRLEGNVVKMKELDVLHSSLEKKMDALRKELYESHEPLIKHLEAVDIDPEGNVTKHTATGEHVVPATARSAMPQLPPIGPFTHTELKQHQSVYAMRSSLLQPWGKGRILRIKEEASGTVYVVRFDSGSKPRTFPLKYLSYCEPSPVQLMVGSRVIAQYIEDTNGVEEVAKNKATSYYAGVIAEAPKYLNQYRYLVFFDDGYAQYCTHQQVLMVCHSSRDVWHDIHMNSRSFISNYLKQFPERAMVKLQRGQMVKTELNGTWLVGRIDTVDASLAKIFFVAESRHEWIYRGSTRLHPLFELLANAEARKNQGATRPTHNLAHVHKRNVPYVEYTRGMDADPPLPRSSVTQPPTAANNQNVVRAVARKSTSKVTKPSLVLATPPPQGEDSYITSEHKGHLKNSWNESSQEIAFEPHQCGVKCIEDFPYETGDFKNFNPLSIPMRRGWLREVTKERFGGARRILYRAPCARRMRNMDEVHRYLRVTGCQLSVDLFCFDASIHCFTEFEPEVVYSKINDITYGKENVPVSCVNSIDRSNPEYVEYSTVRTPREGVNLNLDSNFLSCCDCTDDCQDKEKCQCWQMTIQTTKCTKGSKLDPNAGYQYRRLMNPVLTGVYECNSNCTCRKTCLNRVAQRPLQLRLQLFKTEKRGWGIRCLDDIPKGEFVCDYAGHLLTSQGANEEGTQFGDEYLAELDHIESVERKYGYESDVDIDIDDVSDASRASNSTDDDSGHSADESRNETTDVVIKNKDSSASKNKSAIVSASDKGKDKAVNEETLEKVDGRKTREWFGNNEYIYVMDAKSTGNIGRYLNHCCRPNIFVQNVFVDTHDLRFPWVAFFAMEVIRAGTELTWDYSYDVGSVPDKILYCHCGAKECRGRLL